MVGRMGFSITPLEIMGMEEIRVHMVGAKLQM